MGQMQFLNFVEDKVVQVLMSKGCVKTLKNLFTLLGTSDDKATFFNKSNFIILFSDKESDL
jgi:hypothetical protein